MRPYILAHKSVFSSAKELAQELELRVTSKPKEIPPLIRWGNSEGNYKEDTNLNKRELISLSSRKLSFSDLMCQRGIPCIEYFRNKSPECYPVVIRTILNGRGGAGIVICRNEKEFRPYQGSVWSYWYKFSYELGVHILGGQVVRVFKKIWPGDNEEEFPLRNFERGYSFKLRNIEHYKLLPEAIQKFYAVFPISMARLDIGWDSVGRVYRIIESNSAPGLSHNEATLDMYVEYIKSVLRR